jgi:hypothetical protein
MSISAPSIVQFHSTKARHLHPHFLELSRQNPINTPTNPSSFSTHHRNTTVYFPFPTTPLPLPFPFSFPFRLLVSLSASPSLVFIAPPLPVREANLHNVEEHKRLVLGFELDVRDVYKRDATGDGAAQERGHVCEGGVHGVVLR